MYDVICIDFDGVIAEYDTWKGKGVFGAPIKGIKDAMQALQTAGKTVIIFTTRGEVEDIKVYLDFHQILYNYINHNPNQPEGTNKGKPAADVYVDDKGLRFGGEWNGAVVDQILNFKPWHKQGGE